MPAEKAKSKGTPLWRLSKKFQYAADKIIPDSLVFCLILTFVVFLLALVLTKTNPLDLCTYWFNGLWTQNSFAFQMGIMTVTCATCAKAPQVKRVMNRLASKAHTPAVAMVMLVIFGMVTSFINWAFCTVVGALFAMYLAKNVKGMHFPLMLAVIYTCMVFGQCMGPTASVYALLATEGHFMVDQLGVLSQDITVYNPHNMIIWFTFAIILVIIAITTKPPQHEVVELKTALDDADPNYDVESRDTLADKMNGGKIFMYIIGLAGVIVIAREFLTKGFMGALSMNLIIFLFIVANCFLYKTPRAFIEAYKDNMKLACEIIVQFPFYGGIMGIMQSSGLAQVIISGIVSIASAQTLPVFSFLSACAVNLFIPSQGGQWVVQGPLLIEAAQQLGANNIDVINAFVYGDECTNLLQPLYLIPMLAVVNMKLKDAWGMCAFICLFWVIIVIGGYLIVPGLVPM
ncbi:MAG: short-chain fatty acid transporter [Firmicutes bacterium]|nr:short-chain fatty acid transporter [Bacillota bacterium]